MILVRSLVFQASFYVTLIVLMILGLPSMLMSREAVLGFVRLWARFSLWLLAAICGVKVEFRGLRNLPPGATIIAAKHQSFLETFALLTVLPNFTYILKKELLAIPVFGWWLKAADQIVIDRAKGGGTLRQLQRAVPEKVAEGRQIVIFPEGTRKPVGAPPAYKSGVALLCEACDIPCVPVALNAGLFWPRRGLLRPSGTVIIEFLAPISVGRDKRAFLEALEAAIEPATDALVAEALEANPGLAVPGKVDHVPA
jgi:1-acyl-sn-glycerol-3-phosphate acyltransferase